MARRVSISALVAGMSVLLLAVPAGGHTEVARATPGPGETVEAGVRSVELVFLDPVLPDVSIEVTDLEGRSVAGLATVEVGSDQTTVTVGFDPLAAGRYEVRYSFSAVDGDQQDEGYRFTVEERGPDRGLAPVLTAVVLATVVAALIAVAAWRRRSSRHGP